MNNKSLSILPLVVFIVLLAGVWYYMFWDEGITGTTPPVPTEEKPSTTEIAVATSTSPTASPWATSTPTSSPFPTPTPVPPMPTDTPTPIPTPTPTGTFTPPPTDTPTPTPTDTSTSTPTATNTATTTPTPTLTPLPTATLADVVVIAPNGLNLRSGPGIVYAIIDSFNKGDTLNIEGRVANSSNWIKVTSVKSGAKGWIATLPNLVQINVADLNTIPIINVPPTPVPSIELTSSITITPIYPAPVLTTPDNGINATGTFPPLDWQWDRELGDNEYFEVRIWHENITTYHPALGWVKIPHFDYNITQELRGKYYWTVLIVKGKNEQKKSWTLQPWWPYPMWEGELVQELSPEGEIKFFFYTPPSRICKNCGSPVSKEPPSSGTGPK